MNSNSFWTRFSSNFSKAPLELKFFVIFSLLATCAGLAIKFFSSKEFYESIIPITGWQIFMPYAVTSMTTFMHFSRSKKLNNITRSYYFNIAFLAFYILLMSFEMLEIGEEDYNNPYLKISHLRPIWTSMLPAFWILILLSPRIKKYYESLESNMGII